MRITILGEIGISLERLESEKLQFIESMKNITDLLLNVEFNKSIVVLQSETLINMKSYFQVINV